MAIHKPMCGFRSALLIAALSCLVAGSCIAGSPPQNAPAKLLDRAHQAGAAELARLLVRLHKMENQLSPVQRANLAYLDAKEADLEGKTTEAARMYEQIQKEAGDPYTKVLARSALVALRLRTRHYLEAYTLATTLLAELPEISDARARTEVLFTLTRVAVAEKQYGEALHYAAQMETSATSDMMKCRARVFHTQVLLYLGGTTRSTLPEYRKSIDMCRAAGVLLYTNPLRLDWAGLISDEGHPEQAIADLHRLAPDIRKAGFRTHIALLYVGLADAYLREDRYDLAGSWAHSSLEESDPHGFGWTIEEAYRVLYNVEKNTGHPDAALSMYEKYVEQFKVNADDANAQALAYQEVKQDVLAKRFKVDELSKQNRILQLRQALDHKAAETNRLYVALLLVAIGFIVFWLYRTKHSQLHFRKLARHDGLTGAFNRQHFLEQAERTLRRLRRTSALACLLVLDMDHFKRVNDTFGHIAGDEVLRHAAAICRAELRASDVFGRLGGEEFGILMPGCSPGQGQEIGERICSAMAKSPARLENGDKVSVTTSIGIASTATSGYVLRQLLIDADAALYEAKRSGRNRVSTGIDEDMDVENTETLF